MVSGRVKSLLVAVFSLFIASFFNIACAQPGEGEHHPEAHEGGGGEAKEEKKGFNASEVIFGHVPNAHEFHFLDIGEHPVTIPLPVIVYSPQRGLTSFMSNKFEHGHATHKGYMLLTEESIKHHGLDPKKYNPQDIVAVNEAGEIDETVKVYDISLTRNVVQMLIALILFTWIMLRIAKRYKSGVGVTSAPKGSQSLIEPVITFVRDEVAKPNLGKKADKYLPFIL